MPDPSHRFLRACYRLPVDRIPVWMMRQAGRYQASYREIRRRVGFLQLCHSPELVTQVTVAPIDEFDFDAAILFSDILIHLPAMGLEISFGQSGKGNGDAGPKIANPIRSRSDVEALRIPEPEKDLPQVLAAIRATRRALDNQVPLIGFVGGPFTVATYAAGGGTQGIAQVKELLHSDPGSAHSLFEKLTQAAVVQLQAQIGAGVQAVQVFESWLGELAREDLAEFSLPYLARIAQTVNTTGVPRILFSTGTSSHLGVLATLGYDVLSIDWRIPMAEARVLVPAVAMQGNLDPALLVGSRETLLGRVGVLLEAAAHCPGYIFNLGHGILPSTPPENVAAVVDAVHSFPLTKAAARDPDSLTAAH